MGTPEELVNEYSCDTCGKTFKLKSKFYLHKVSHEVHKYQLASKSWTCSCGLMFHTEWQMSVHQREHALQEKWHYCHQCGECFPSSMYLKQHQYQYDHKSRKLMLTEGVTYRCGVLDESSSSHSDDKEADLSLNEETSISEDCEDDDFDVHICNICGEACESKWCYECHMNIHLKKSLYYCKLCDSSFKCSNNLELHLQVHTRRSYRCCFCPKAYIRKSFLGHHLNVHADKVDMVGGVQRYTCCLCERITTGKKLTRHHFIHMYGYIGKQEYKRVKDSDFQRKSRGSTYGNRIGVIKSEEDKERAAKRRAVYEADKLERLRTMSRQRRGECICVGDACTCYMCSLCERNFQVRDLKSHLELHTGQLIQCEECEQTFSNNLDFLNHAETCVYSYM